MPPEEAHRIASARLGTALHNVTRGGPNGDEWLVQAVPPSGPLLSARAASLEEAIGEAEAQLRAAGWVPTHPRLEWSRTPARFILSLVVGKLTVPVVEISTTSTVWLVSIDGIIRRARTPADVLAATVAYVESLDLPCLLPPFPGASNAF